MTRLCFGGSFNPIHAGHLVVARAVAEVLGYQSVVLIPSAQPPHKPVTADLAGANDRLAMCQLVAKADSLFEVEALELSRQGPSYTLDTAVELKRKGWPEVHWLIGADMLQILPQWHRPLELLKEVRFVIAQRPGYEIDWRSLGKDFEVLRENVVTAPLIQISASDIRRRVRENKPIRYLVSPEVEDYILRQRLYRA